MTRPFPFLRSVLRLVPVLGALALGACAGAKSGGGSDHESFDELFSLGMAQQEANDPAAAAATFGRILNRDPKNVKALVHQGIALEDSNQHEEAEKLYRKAIQIAPNDPLPRINLGSLLYFHSRKTYEAKTELVKAIELAPDNPDAHFNLGVLFADAGLYREAKVEWETVLRVGADGPASALARDNLERIDPLLGEGDEGAEDDGASHDGHAHP